MSASNSATDLLPAGVPNPFADAAVGTVWETPVADVEEIHAGVFAELLRVVDERLEGRHDRCLLLYGQAGSGKTHLLRRLRLHLAARAEPFIPFSWIWMGTSPGMMWRYLRPLSARPPAGGPEAKRRADSPQGSRRRSPTSG